MRGFSDILSIGLIYDVYVWSLSKVFQMDEVIPFIDLTLHITAVDGGERK